VQYTICLAADTLALYVYIFVDGFLQTVWKVWQTITLQNKNRIDQAMKIAVIENVRRIEYYS